MLSFSLNYNLASVATPFFIFMGLVLVHFIKYWPLRKYGMPNLKSNIEWFLILSIEDVDGGFALDFKKQLLMLAPKSYIPSIRNN